MNRLVVFWVALLMLVGGSTIFAIAYRNSSTPEPGSSSEVDPEAETLEPLTEFTLTDQNSEKFSSKSLEGKVWIGNFFFSLCTSECPAQNRKIGLLMSKFQDDGLECVSITCDPARDTPTHLLSYSKEFNADPTKWHFLTDPNFDYLKQIANNFFNLALERYTHTDNVVLFNRKCEVHGVYSVMKPAAFLELHEAIETVLNEEQVTDDQTEAAVDEVKSDSDIAPAKASPTES